MTQQNDWMDGLEKDNEYKFGFLKIDIVGHSKITAWWPNEKTAPVFDKFEEYVETHVKNNYGKVWSWLGDGGLCAFWGNTAAEKAQNAYKAADSILTGLREFNTNHQLPDPENNEIKVRIAAHLGDAVYRGSDSLGRIHSEAINFVAHLETKRTYVNSISISQNFYKQLDPSMKREFVSLGRFKDAGEEHVIYTNDKANKNNFQPEEWELIWDEKRCERLKDVITQLQPNKTLLTTRYSPRPINQTPKSREYVEALNQVIDQSTGIRSRVYRIISLDHETKKDYAKDLIDKHGDKTNFALAVAPYSGSILDFLVVNDEEVCFGIQTGDEKENFWIRVRDPNLAHHVADYYHSKLSRGENVEIIKASGKMIHKQLDKDKLKAKIEELYEREQVRLKNIRAGCEIELIFTPHDSARIRREIYELANENAKKKKGGTFYSLFLSGTKKREGDFYNIIRQQVRKGNLSFYRAIIKRNEGVFQNIIKDTSSFCKIYIDKELSKIYKKRHYYLEEIVPNAIIYTHDTCNRALLDFTAVSGRYGFGLYTRDKETVQVLEKRIEKYFSGLE